MKHGEHVEKMDVNVMKKHEKNDGHRLKSMDIEPFRSPVKARKQWLIHVRTGKYASARLRTHRAPHMCGEATWAVWKARANGTSVAFSPGFGSHFAFRTCKKHQKARFFQWFHWFSHVF